MPRAFLAIPTFRDSVRGMIKENLGLTLIEIVVTMFVFALLALGLGQMQLSVSNAVNRNDGLSTKSLIERRIDRHLNDVRALQKTLNDPSNLNLSLCLNPDPSVTLNCTETPSPQGFKLLDGAGNMIAGSGSTQPAFYDFNGSPCTAVNPSASSPCLIQVYTEYMAKCPSGSSPCADPIINLNYRINLYSPNSASPGQVVATGFSGGGTAVAKYSPAPSAPPPTNPYTGPGLPCTCGPGGRGIRHSWFSATADCRCVQSGSVVVQGFQPFLTWVVTP